MLPMKHNLFSNLSHSFWIVLSKAQKLNAYNQPSIRRNLHQYGFRTSVTIPKQCGHSRNRVCSRRRARRKWRVSRIKRFTCLWRGASSIFHVMLLPRMRRRHKDNASYPTGAVRACNPNLALSCVFLFYSSLQEKLDMSLTWEFSFSLGENVTKLEEDRVECRTSSSRTEEYMWFRYRRSAVVGGSVATGSRLLCRTLWN